ISKFAESQMTLLSRVTRDGTHRVAASTTHNRFVPASSGYRPHEDDGNEVGDLNRLRDDTPSRTTRVPLGCHCGSSWVPGATRWTTQETSPFGWEFARRTPCMDFTSWPRSITSFCSPTFV